MKTKIKTLKKIEKATDFDDYLNEELKDPKAKAMYDEFGRQLDLAYKILQLRKAKKMSQAELAAKIGTTQSNVARIEAGKQNFTISLLHRVAVALESNLSINFL